MSRPLLTAVLLMAFCASARAQTIEDRFGGLPSGPAETEVDYTRKQIKTAIDALLTKQSKLRGDEKLKIAKRIHALRVRERLCGYYQDERAELRSCLRDVVRFSKDEKRGNEPLETVCAKLPQSTAGKVDCETEAEMEAAYVKKIDMGVAKVKAYKGGAAFPASDGWAASDRIPATDEFRERGVTQLADTLISKSVHPDRVPSRAPPLRLDQPTVEATARPAPKGKK